MSFYNNMLYNCAIFQHNLKNILKNIYGRLFFINSVKSYSSDQNATHNIYLNFIALDKIITNDNYLGSNLVSKLTNYFDMQIDTICIDTFYDGFEKRIILDKNIINSSISNLLLSDVVKFIHDNKTNFMQQPDIIMNHNFIPVNLCIQPQNINIVHIVEKLDALSIKTIKYLLIYQNIKYETDDILEYYILSNKKIITGKKQLSLLLDNDVDNIEQYREKIDLNTN